MLEEGGGPVRIEDFPDDDPRERPDPGWQPPLEGRRWPPMVRRRPSRTHSRPSCHGSPHAYDRSVARRGRTTVGLSGLSISAAAHYLAAGCAARRRRARSPTCRRRLALRFALDDVKAYYLEAALAPGQTVEPPARRLAVERDRRGRGDVRVAPRQSRRRRRAPEADRQQLHGPRHKGSGGGLRPPRRTGIGQAERRPTRPRRVDSAARLLQDMAAIHPGEGNQNARDADLRPLCRNPL